MNITSEGLRGDAVLLMVPSPEQDAVAMADWTRDSEYFRLAMSEPARFRYPPAQKKWLEDESTGYMFMIKTVEDQKVIGQVGISEINPVSLEGWLSIAIGERNYWGKGYGAEAMRLIMEFGFSVLNLNRISLDVFEYNPRAIHVYQKLGFKIEGAERQHLNRDGKRWDLIHMGLLKEEWLQIYHD